MRVAPFPVSDLSFPKEDTSCAPLSRSACAALWPDALLRRERTAAMHRLASTDSPRSGASSQRPSPRARDAAEPSVSSSVTSLPRPADAAAYVVPPNVRLPSLGSGPVLPPNEAGEEDEVSSGLLLPPPAAGKKAPPSPVAATPPQRARGSPVALPAALSKAAAGGGAALVLLHLLGGTGSRRGAYNGKKPLPTGTLFGGGEHLIVWRPVSARAVRQRANLAR